MDQEEKNKEQHEGNLCSLSEAFKVKFCRQVEPSRDMSADDAIERVKAERGIGDIPWDTAMILVAEIERLHAEIEPLEIMSDPEAMAAIEQGMRDIAEGKKGMSPEELEKELGLSPRQGGEWEGKVEIAPDFDAPPEGFAEAFGIEDEKKEG